MLRKTRTALAIIFFVGITMLFLDFTGVIHHYLGWMAKIQLLPALLAVNIIVVLLLIALTLLFGRVYCSIICPMGVMQDCFTWLGNRFKRNRFTYRQPLQWLRWVVLAMFVVLMIAGLNSIAVLIAPYSAYGRIASNLLHPIYLWINNLLASWAEHADSYRFYSVDTWIKSGITLLVAIVTLVIIGTLSLMGGRTWCNTICPVGTILGALSRFSILKPVINTEKCAGCKKCERNCKAHCINIEKKRIDYSRCVTCFDCIDLCSKGAIEYRRPSKVNNAETPNNIQNEGRRKFLATTAAVGTATILQAEEAKVDGGLAVIEDKQIPIRNMAIKPAGALSQKHFAQHCTSCQLCVAECPNGVLRPSKDIANFMQPEMSFENGYCRPECVRCSEVCPAGAIKKIDVAEKSAIHFGMAVVHHKNCLPIAEGVSCGNCARHCPTNAITMVPLNPNDDPELAMSLKKPVVNTDKCIGCGACENLCPSRPFSAIHVEGRQVHIHD